MKSSLVVGAVEFDREYLVQGSQCTLAVAPRTPCMEFIGEKIQV